MPLIGASAVGVALLASGDTRMAGVAVLLLGFGIGAQIDVLGYFTRRYFGVTAYSTMFRWTYGIIALGSAVGPVIVGGLRDRGEDDGIGLFASSVAMVIASLLCLSMGRYPNISEAEAI